MNQLTRKYWLAFALLLPGWSATVFAETPSFQILNYSFSTRASGLGGTRAALVQPQLDVGGNPAAISFTNGIQGQATTVAHLVGIKGYSSAGVIPLEQHRLSGQVTYFDYGIFDRADEFGQTSSTFGFHELTLEAGYAYKTSDRLSVGTRLGVVQRVADGQTTSRGIGSAGIIYFSAEDSLSIGILLENLSVGEGNETLPTSLRVGTSKILTYLPVRLNLDAHYAFTDDWLLALGGEILLHPQFTLRVGVNTHRFDLQSGVSRGDFLAGTSAGFSLSWRQLLIEMAAQNYGAVGTITQFSLGIQL